MPDDYYVSQYSGEEIDALLASAGAGAVRYDAAQTLTAAQKTQARGNIAAAPDGFGYGGALDTVSGATDEAFLAAVESKLATMPDMGAMQINWGSYPALDGLARVGTLTKHTGGQYASLTGYSYGGTAITRCKNAGAWDAWEWVNPPMQLGVEYRTTERYRGKPVYQKLIDFGALPNNTQKSVSIFASGEANTMECGIDVKLISHGNQAYKGLDALATQVLQNGNVTIVTKYDLSESSVYALCYYTKTTD